MCKDNNQDTLSLKIIMYLVCLTDIETTDKPFTSVLDPLTLESRFKVTESESEEEGKQEEEMSEDEEAR